MTTPSSPADLTIVPIETPTLGDRSYLVHDGDVAFVVDPQRDIDRVTDLLAEHGVRLTHVLETHIHNDYVTGGFALARATGAAYLVNAADDVSFERTPISDGDVVEVGDRMRLTALATPGHTFTHLSYALRDLGPEADSPGRDVGVFSTCHVVCRPTQGEAEAYYEHYAATMADQASVDKYMGAKEKFSNSHEAEAYRLHRKRFAAGAGTYPLVGTPQHIAEEMVKMSEVGFAGITVSFVNFKNELPYFIDTVMPLLCEAGLRAPRP